MIAQTLSLSLLGAACLSASAQLTSQQRLDDLRSLAALYNKHYAPYEIKQQLFNVDMLDLRPWIAKSAAARNDIEFYGVLREYAASLQDGHASFEIPSAFTATLSFGVDFYDGRPLIDFIIRQRLPADRFPFETGDELISVNAVEADLCLPQFLEKAERLGLELGI